MYGTIAKLKVKPGGLEALKAMEERRPAGFVSTLVYQSDTNADELWLAVVFESKEAYFKNAQSPEQHKEYLRLREHLAQDPEWHDGEIVFHSSAT